jgi:invasion protein IalB
MFVTSFIAYRPEWAGFKVNWQTGMLEGSTPMGPSKHLNGPHASQDARGDASHRSRLSSAGRWSLRVSLAAAALLGLTAAASAQGAVRSVHGDWQIRCDTPPGAQTEQCALIQSVVAEDRSNAGLTVIVLKTADQKSKLMRVVAPLGVLLPSGLGLKLDNVDVGRAGFVRCLPNGCVAEVVMDDKLLGQLRTAKTATFIIFETPEEGIGFPLSLNGLGEGYDKLP